VLSSYGDAVGVWTNATDTSPGTDVKTSLTVSAASELTVATDAVTLQLQFGNLMTRAYPELIARHNELALIQHAREAEQYLASKLTAGSTAITTTSLIGVARDFLVQVGRASAQYRSRHRLDASQNLKVIAPTWIRDAMIADAPGHRSTAAKHAAAAPPAPRTATTAPTGPLHLERVRASHQATHDALTGLYNRQFFIEHLQQQMPALPARSDGELAAGHPGSDRVLDRVFDQRLQQQAGHQHDPLGGAVDAHQAIESAGAVWQGCGQPRGYQPGGHVGAAAAVTAA
jgi:GGDEF domain-containing protein